MKAKELLKELKKLLNETPLEAAEKLNYDSPSEVGLKHPYHAGMVLLRDDGLVELSAGPNCYLHLDASQGLATLKGNAITLGGNYLSLLSDNLYINYHRLDPTGFWCGGGLEQNLIPPLMRAPIVANSPASLPSTYITGVPQAGQTLVSFSEIFSSQLLFGPSEQELILMRNIALLAKCVIHPHI